MNDDNFLFLVAGGVLLWSLQRRRKATQGATHMQLSGATGGPLAPFRAAAVQSGVYRLRDQTFQLQCRQTQSRKNRSQAFFSISLPLPSEVEFRISREGLVDRISEGLGLAGKLSTGDPDFDQVCYCFSETPDFLTGLLSDPAARKIVKDLLSLGFTEVRHDGAVIEARWSGFQLDRDSSPALVPSAAPLLGSIAARIPRVPDSARHQEVVRRVAERESHNKGAKRGLIVALLAFAALFAVLDNEFPLLDTRALAMASLKFSVPLGIIFMANAGKILQTHSSKASDALALALLSVLACAGGGLVAYYGANVLLDSAASESHDAIVLSKRTTGSKSVQNLVYVQSWREGRAREEIAVSARDYYRITPNSTRLQVMTKPGRFSLEWIAGLRFEN